MSLDDLLGLTERLKERVKSHDSLLQQNEIRTRYALVDPLLKALGWDTEDPAQVTVEYTTGNNKRADYALLSGDGKPVMFIEVKKLDRPLTDGLSQSIGYCLEDGVQYFAVTDGARWEVYDTHKPVPIAQKKFAEFSLHKGVNEFVLGSLWLWRGNHATGTPVSPPMPAQPSQPTPLPLPPPPQPAPSPSLQHIAPPAPRMWIPLSRLNPKSNDKPPQALLLPNGTELAIRYWWNLSTEIVKWLLQNGILTPDKCPILKTRSSGRYHVAMKDVHPDGKQFGGLKQIGSYYIDTKHPAPQAVTYVQYLLEQLGQDPAQFSLRF